MAGVSVLEKFKHVKSFQIPTLSCSLLAPQATQHSANPFYSADEIDKWSFSFIGSQSANVNRRRQLVQWKIGLLAALGCPNMPSRRLRLVAQLMAWLFLADDIFEESEVCLSDKKNGFAAYIKILKGEYEEAKRLIQSKELLRQMDMFHVLCEELTSSMKSYPKDRFVEAMEEYLDMVRVELGWADHKILPNVETYMWMRRATSGAKPFFVAVDGLQGLDIDEEVCGDPLIQKLEATTIEHICLINDIVSFPKEWVSGQYLNIVPVLAFQHGSSLDEALLRAAKMVENCEAEYAKVKASLNGELLSKKGVKEYVEALETWMKGHFEWCRLTRRYSKVTFQT